MNKDLLQEKYTLLLKNHLEMQEYLMDLMEEHKRLSLEEKYLRDFIEYEQLREKYQYFREHAHEDENSELPFPSFIL